MDKLAGFASHHGPDFYHLPRNTEMITLVRSETLEPPPDIEVDGDKIRQFLPETPVRWHLIDEQQ